MSGKGISNLISSNKLVLLAFGLGILYWVLESAVDSFIFHEGSLITVIFTPEPHEIWMRTMVFIFLIIFGFYIQFVITKRNRAEEALWESENRLRNMWDSVQTGIVIINAETHAIVDANPMAMEMIGAPREQIIGSVCHRYICPAERGQCPITDLGQRVEKSEQVLLKPDGSSMPVIKTVVSTMLKGRRHLIESFMDITERKQMEQQLAEYTRSLENAYQELQKLDQMKDGFLSTVSHELRTPLTSIKGFAEILLSYEEEDKETQREFLTIINDESDRLTRLINDFLDLARIEAGRQQWEDTELKISEVVEMAINATHALFSWE